MIARCIYSNYSLFAKNDGLMRILGAEASEESRMSAVNLVLGEEYLVVAMALGPSSVWLFLADRFRGLKYPLIYPVGLFTITDSSRSKFWRWAKWIDRLGASHDLLAPPEWADDPLFHGRLFDGEKPSQATYEEMLLKLQMEYPLPWVAERAVSLSLGNWVADSSLDEQWETSSEFAMIQNPRTKRLLHNPLYDPTTFIESAGSKNCDDQKRIG